jgi:hypothetical protein
MLQHCRFIRRSWACLKLAARVISWALVRAQVGKSCPFDLGANPVPSQITPQLRAFSRAQPSSTPQAQFLGRKRGPAGLFQFP